MNSNAFKLRDFGSAESVALAQPLEAEPAEAAAPEIAEGEEPPAPYIPYNWERSQRLIEELETLSQSKILVYWVHNDSQIADDDASNLFHHLQRMGKVESLTLVLTAPGGSGLAALRIAQMLRAYTDRLEVMIPHAASSAATLLALAAEKIVMTPIASLSPVDVSINHPLNPMVDKMRVSVEDMEVRHFFQAAHREAMRFKDSNVYPVNAVELLSKHVHPLVLGALERSATLSRRVTSEILRLHMQDEARIDKIVSELNDGYPSHFYPISFVEAQKLGLPVVRASTALEKILWELEMVMRNTMYRNEDLIGSDGRTTSANVSCIESLNYRVFCEVRDEESFARGAWNLTRRAVTWWSTGPNAAGDGYVIEPL